MKCKINVCSSDDIIIFANEDLWSFFLNCRDIVKLVGELKGTSTEIMTTMAENLQLSQELANLEGQLKGLQGKIAKVEREIVDLKQNPETTAGVKSDRIQMY